MSPASLGQLREGKAQQPSRQHPPVLSLPPDKPRCCWDPQTLYPVRREGSRKHLSPRTRQVARLACGSSPYLRRIQPESRAPWPGPATPLSPTTPRAGPGPRLAVVTSAIWPPGAQPGQGGNWVATPRKALPWRPACGASPRTARTAPPALAPRGGRAQPIGKRGADTPCAPGAAAAPHWLGKPGGCGLGRGGRGRLGAQ